jgi:hypothetical protein
VTYLEKISRLCSSHPTLLAAAPYPSSEEVAMTKQVTERYSQERLDDDRARRMAEILAQGLLARFKALRRSGLRLNRAEAVEASTYLPNAPPDTGSEDTEDGP